MRPRKPGYWTLIEWTLIVGALSVFTALAVASCAGRVGVAACAQVKGCAGTR